MEFKLCKYSPNIRCRSVSAYVSSGEQRESHICNLHHYQQAVLYTSHIAQLPLNFLFKSFLTDILNMSIAPDFLQTTKICKLPQTPYAHHQKIKTASLNHCLEITATFISNFHSQIRFCPSLFSFKSMIPKFIIFSVREFDNHVNLILFNILTVFCCYTYYSDNMDGWLQEMNDFIPVSKSVKEIRI